MPIKDSIVPGATETIKARKLSSGLTQIDLGFILQAIRDSKIPGKDLQQAIVTIGKIQDIWEQFENAKNKRSPFGSSGIEGTEEDQEQG